MPDLPLAVCLADGSSTRTCPATPTARRCCSCTRAWARCGLWRGFPAAVAAATGRRAVAYSRLGHGWSDLPPAPRTPDVHARGGGHRRPRAVRGAGPGPTGAGRAQRRRARSRCCTPPAADVSGAGRAGAARRSPSRSGWPGSRPPGGAFRGGDLRAPDGPPPPRPGRHLPQLERRVARPGVPGLGPAARCWPASPRPVLAVQGTADPYGTVAHVEAVRDAVVRAGRAARARRRARPAPRGTRAGHGGGRSRFLAGTARRAEPERGQVEGWRPPRHPAHRRGREDRPPVRRAGPPRTAGTSRRAPRGPGRPARPPRGRRPSPSTRTHHSWVQSSS